LDWKILKEKVGLSQNEMEIIAEYACKKAYKFGDELSLSQASVLVRNLSNINGPFNCPHSRPLVGYYGKN
jgi:DNA mismatch repair protein MutL